MPPGREQCVLVRRHALFSYRSGPPPPLPWSGPRPRASSSPMSLCNGTQNHEQLPARWCTGCCSEWSATSTGALQPSRLSHRAHGRPQSTSHEPVHRSAPGGQFSVRPPLCASLAPRARRRWGWCPVQGLMGYGSRSRTHKREDVPCAVCHNGLDLYKGITRMTSGFIPLL